MRHFALPLVLTLLAACNSANGHRELLSRLETNSDTADTPSYASLVDAAKNLESSGSLVQVAEYGKSVNGLSLTLVRIGQDVSGGSAAGRPAVLISEAIHGNEYLGLGHKLLPWLVEQARSGTNDFFVKGGIAIVVPVVNPDGYEYHRLTSAEQQAADGGPDGGNSWGRMNADRIDLNRDFAVKGAGFAGFRELESKAMAAGVREALGGADLRVSLDYHCCIGDGALLYSYAFSETRQLPQADEARVRHFGSFFQQELAGSELGRTPDLAGYAAVGTTIDYYYETYKTASIIYEGRHGGEGDRVESHEKAWGAILADLARDRPNAVITPVDSDVKVSLWGDAAKPAFAVATSGAKSVQVCAGSQCITMGKTVQHGDREIRYDESTLTIPAGGAMSAVVERADGKKTTTSFQVTASH